jgi:hypothetical protein
MPSTPKKQSIPDPAPSIAGNRTLDGTRQTQISSQAAKYRPKNAILETLASTVSRYAVRLINRKTGEAYSADELPAFISGYGSDGIHLGFGNPIPAAKNVVFGPFGEIGCFGYFLITSNTNTAIQVGFYISNITQSRAYESPNNSGTIALECEVYSATPTSGFNIPASRYSDQTYYLSHSTTLATGIFTLPIAGVSRVGQIIRLFTKAAVTSLSTSVAGGGTIVGAALTSTTANGSYSWQCVSNTGTGTWIRLL